MKWRQLSGLVAVVALAASCGSSDVERLPAAERTVASTTTVSASSSASVGTEIVDHGDLDPEAVVVAAVLIASGGDLEAAIADEWITEAEAAAALAGIEDGSLAAVLD